MANAITRQVSEEIKRTMEVAGSAKPVHEEEPCRRAEGMPSLHLVERSCEVAQSDRSDRLFDGREHPMLRRPPPMMAPPRPQNGRKYYEFHEQNEHPTTKCRELRKSLHELADKGQIDRFLKRGPRLLRQEQTLAPPPPQDKECSTEVVDTIAGGYEVNPTGIICLPVRFGDKSKFKSLEVDFLVVNVPTAYNVIIGQPTLHKVKAIVAPTTTRREHSFIKNKATQHNHLQPCSRLEVKASMNKSGWGLHVRLSAVLTTFLLRRTGLSFQRIGGLVLSSFTLRRRGDKFHLLRIVALYSSLFAFVHKAQSSKYRSSENSPVRVSKTLWRRGRPSGLTDSPAPWPGPHQSWSSPVDAASLFHGPLGPPGASHNTFGTGKRLSPAASTLRPPSPPGQRPQPLPSPSRTPLGGPEPQGWPSPRT
ncbi:LOW QUALITY PROTEIN: hypothetical protein Cgig2_000404 [Carnegiea gigantea]|uniref:Uncharacterized protein n=1 Tax=Carnegiea gigantea TaxID=171969 RepID=A0A9Q1QEN4_9CARY|nr:LOW QUALITY PROTEIN: hypothetical protein Cgig2_000404 [Carnegiea gigantea]